MPLIGARPPPARRNTTVPSAPASWVAGMTTRRGRRELAAAPWEKFMTCVAAPRDPEPTLGLVEAIVDRGLAAAQLPPQP